MTQAMSATFSAAAKVTSYIPGLGQGGSNSSTAMPSPSSQGTYQRPDVSSISSGSFGGSRPPQGPWGSGTSMQQTAARATPSTSAGQYEARVVEEICAPG